jgi:hypothetical protein
MVARPRRDATDRTAHVRASVAAHRHPGAAPPMAAERGRAPRDADAPPLGWRRRCCAFGCMVARPRRDATDRTAHVRASVAAPRHPGAAPPMAAERGRAPRDADAPPLVFLPRLRADALVGIRALASERENEPPSWWGARSPSRSDVGGGARRHRSSGPRRPSSSALASPTARPNDRLRHEMAVAAANRSDEIGQGGNAIVLL